MNAQAVVERMEQPEPASTALTPMDMVGRAVASGASIEVVEKLMALHERWEAGQARKAFDAAMADAKGEIPVILKNREVGFEHKTGDGKTSYRHEDLGEIARTVDPILAKHGLSYRFRTTSAMNEPVSVTCIVAHRNGHSEENTLTAGRDDSGKKNSIQQIGSTITYLQRYTLKAALGLAASADDDGISAAAPLMAINDQQREDLSKLLDETGADEAKFMAFFGIEFLAELPAKRFGEAKTMLEQKKARK